MRIHRLGEAIGLFIFVEVDTGCGRALEPQMRSIPAMAGPCVSLTSLMGGGVVEPGSGEIGVG